MDKPVADFTAGAAAPPGKRLGHADAIVLENSGSYASKRGALEAAGTLATDTLFGIASALIIPQTSM